MKLQTLIDTLDQLPNIHHGDKEAIIEAYKNGYSEGKKDGYNEGFEMAQAAERGIIAVQSKIDEYDQAHETPATDTSKPAGAPGASELQDLICGGIRL